LKKGGNALALGLDEEDARVILPLKVSFKKAEHIAASFKPFADGSLTAGVSSADVHSREPQNLSLVTQGAEVVGDGVLAKAPGANVVFCQLLPWTFEGLPQANLRRTQRRTTFLVSRLLANMGVAPSTPLLERFHEPVSRGQSENRWLTGFYSDKPEEWDDPYRFFRW
jgi:hypothetical protein